ncbi:hypothetical protein CPC16_000824 [Podila verticillata]|nr:hypothetical protein BGZ52_007471 [Haplosporangium bisporale]KAF9205197.1 hypothetical protein BGZ59_000607 [Podila verticillata]KAF9375261.1 hypothetical protein CPC16_000824 [Podila verticillata]KFH67384.1 hypothetical protein MVEG_06118 [Podila verticillata NRRL 6337]
MTPAQIPILTETPFPEWAHDIERARVANGIPGMSVAVVHRGKIIFAQGFGVRNENNDPFTEETVAPIASQTKAFTSAAIGELVAEGKMDWTKTPVNAYLPEFQLKDPLLTSQLNLTDILSHRSGIQGLDISWYNAKESRRNLIKKMRHVEAKYPLRAEWQYNNICYAVAGEAAANVAGVEYEDLVRDKVLRPLGLANTGFSQTEMGKRPNYAMPYCAKSMEEARSGKYEPGELDRTFMKDAAAGDLYSNVLDLAVWAKAMMGTGALNGKQILNKESIEYIQTGHSVMTGTRRGPEFGAVEAYGLAWMIDSYKGHIVNRHSGSVFGYRSNSTHFPNAELAVMVLTNMDCAQLPINLPYYIADSLLNLPKTKDWLIDVSVTDTQKDYKEAGAGARGDHLPPQIKNTAVSRDLQDYVGEYEHPYYQSAFVRLESSMVDKEGHSTSGNIEQESKSRLQFQYSNLVAQLEHYHYESFRAQLVDFTFEIATLFTFTTGNDGQVNGITSDFFGEQVHWTKK